MSVTKEKKDLRVAIIGGGVSGICLAIQFRKIGFHNFTIYERDVDMGGTWLTNTYPGCRCDVPAHLYSLSTHLNPNWSETRPPQTELLEYWRRIVDQEQVRKYCKFLTSFISAHWDESSQEWVAKMKPTNPQAACASYAQGNIKPDGKEFEIRCDVLISATGGFSWPLIPKIPGLPNPYLSDDQPKSLFNVQEQNVSAPVENGNGNGHAKENGHAEEQFKGTVIHPARWPRGGIDLRGKTVAVLGNGCSATQIVPEISKDPEVKVLNFARSGQWYKPGPIQRFNRLWKFLFRFVPGFQRLYRFWEFLRMDLGWLAWELPNKGLRAQVEKECRDHIKNTAPKDAVDVLTPKFPFGAKRPVIDVSYLKSLNQPNVQLVQQRISRINEHSILTADGKEHPVDVIVIATGFDLTAAMLDVTGKQGVNVTESVTREDGPQAYRGMMYPGFPNFYALLGHNVAPGHTSVIINIETQAEYVAQVLNAQIRNKVKTVEVKEEPTREYNVWLDKKLDNTTWTQATSFYRLGKDRSGRIFTNWPAPTGLYCWQNRRPIWKDLSGVEHVESHKTAKLTASVVVLAAAASLYRYMQ